MERTAAGIALAPHGEVLPHAFDHLTSEQAAALCDAESLLIDAWDRAREGVEDLVATEYLRDRLLELQRDHCIRPPRRQRGKLSLATRTRVMERGGWCCQRCGTTEDLVVDHDLPVARGVLCSSCNGTKGATL